MTETLDRIQSVRANILENFAAAEKNFEKCHTDEMQRENQTLTDVYKFILECGNSIQ